MYLQDHVSFREGTQINKWLCFEINTRARLIWIPKDIKYVCSHSRTCFHDIPLKKILPPSGQQQNIKNISKYFKINFQTPNSRQNYSNFKFQTNLSFFWETNDSRLTDSHPSFQSSKKRVVWISLLAILVLQGINDQLLTPRCKFHPWKRPGLTRSVWRCIYIYILYLKDADFLVAMLVYQRVHLHMLDFLNC